MLCYFWAERTDYHTDIDSGIATVRFKADDRTYIREIFFSYPEREKVIGCEVDEPAVLI